MKTETKKQIKMKSGVVIPAGTIGELVYLKSHYATFESAIGKFCISLIKAGDKFKGMKNVPSMSSLEKKMQEDCCVCKTVTGATTEPDGEDEYGFPSHLKMLSLI